MIKSVILLCSFWAVGNFSDSDHAIYLSMVEIDHGMNNDIARLSIKVFIDDFEDALKNEFQKPVKFSESNTCGPHSLLVSKYFDKHFSLSVNESPIKPTLNQCEMKGDALWFTFDLNCPQQWSSVQVNADFLMELFPTQSNVVSVKENKAKQFLNLTSKNPSGTIKF